MQMGKFIAQVFLLLNTCHVTYFVQYKPVGSDAILNEMQMVCVNVFIYIYIYLTDDCMQNVFCLTQ